LLDERASVVQRYVVDENCILSFKTHVQALGNIEKTEEQKLKFNNPMRKIYRTSGIPKNFGPFAQSPLVSCERLNTLHQAALATLLDKLKSKEMGLVVELMDTHSAVKALRKMVHPSQTSDDWRPYLPGDQIPYRETSVLPGLGDNEFYPSISAQIFKQTPLKLGTVQKVGEDYWASVTMELSPQAPERFDKLFRALPQNIDWRFSLSIIGGDSYFAGKIKTRQSWAKIFKVTNSAQNESIVDATTELLAIRREGEKLGGLRIILTIRSDSYEKALRDVGQCASIFQAWGNLDTCFEHGDPWDSVVSSMPGLDSKITGNTVVVPLRETTILCPTTRPMSPWYKAGANLWRTPDGKIFPYQSCSSLQHTWVTLIYAKPGAGKSVSLGSQNFNLCLQPGLKRLPKIAILDIGPSSLGCIELVKSILPADRQHEAVHQTLKNDRYNAINPFDTPLGFRTLTSSKMEYLTNFLLILFMEKGQDKLEAGLGELVPDLIRETYRYFNDEHHPKLYTRSVEPKIDQLIENHPDWFELDLISKASKSHRLTWWNIVDVLSEKKYWHEALLAQRYAVPLLADLSRILNAVAVLKDTHGGSKKDTDIFQFIYKMISSATDQFPILSYPTKFNLSDARVVALDLADVVSGNDEFALKRAGLMYMLGREVLVGNYYFGEEDLRGHTSPARAYHEARLNRELSEVKRICYDEFHRTSALKNIRHQVIQDMREARKFKIDLVLVSQSDTDFDQTMLDLATSIFIFRGVEGTELNRVCEKFDLNDSARNALKYQVHGASSEGASFMLKCQTKIGSFVQVLVNSMGPTELWALASTAEDTLLRRRLAQKMSYLDAIRLLAKEFPAGSCKKALDEVIEKRNMVVEDVLEMFIDKLTQQTR
jgi:intracellular multiplication protein IcmB